MEREEILIPSDCVPKDILNQLKTIWSRLPQQASGTSTASHRDGDECDNPSATTSHGGSVVHLGLMSHSEVDMTSQIKMDRDSDVVRLFGNPSAKDTQNPRNTGVRHVRSDSDVVSVFLAGSSPSKDVDSARPRQSQTSQQQSPLPGEPQQSVAPPCFQGSQQYLTPSFQSQTQHPDQYNPLPNSHRLSPSKSLSGPEGEEVRRMLHNRSPSKTPVRHDSLSRQQLFLSAKQSQSPSGSEAFHTTASTSSSLSPLSSHSRSPPSHKSGSNDDVVRVLPPRAVTPPGQEAACQGSPKMLTPPETPENEGKPVAPEVFTFDELTCAQERLLQTCERLHQLHDQFTPTKRTSSIPRHPSSTPSTPSFRRQDYPRSPSLHPASRRISPVDSRLLHCLEATAPSPQKKASEVPGSPAAAKQATPKRVSVEEYSPQRRDSLPPSLPKKRLDFEEEGLSQRLRTYDLTGAPHCIPSPRPSGSGSETMFAFPATMDGPQFGRVPHGTPTKTAFAAAEFQERFASLAAFQDMREAEDEDERATMYFRGLRRYDSLDFNRMAMHNSRGLLMKRKRHEAEDERNDLAECTCAVMEQRFLHMAECAYKPIRRLDSTPEDFDRFRMELAQTNDILRESLELLKHIRDICDHRKRPRR